MKHLAARLLEFRWASDWVSIEKIPETGYKQTSIGFIHGDIIKRPEDSGGIIVSKNVHDKVSKRWTSDNTNWKRKRSLTGRVPIQNGIQLAIPSRRLSLTGRVEKKLTVFAKPGKTAYTSRPLNTF